MTDKKKLKDEIKKKDDEIDIKILPTQLIAKPKSKIKSCDSCFNVTVLT